MNMSNFLYKDNKKLILQCLLVGLLIIAGLWVPRLNIVALFAAIVCIWTLDKEDILCFTSFLVSFSPIFKITLGGFTFFNVIIIVDVLRGLILSKFCLKKNTSIQLIILTFYTLATGFKNGILDVFTFLCYLFLVELLYSQETTSMHKLVTFTTLGIITTSGVSLLKSNFPRLVQIMNEATIRLSAGNYYYRFAGIETNPNYYTLLLSVCIAAFLVLFIEGQNKKIDYLYVGTLIFFGMLTVSQSFIVTLAICMIIVILTIGGIGLPEVRLALVPKHYDGRLGILDEARAAGPQLGKGKEGVGVFHNHKGRTFAVPARRRGAGLKHHCVKQTVRHLLVQEVPHTVP